MSHSMEKKSQISSAKITVDRDDPALHTHLATIFRKVVSEKISILEAMQQEQVKQEDLVKNAATTGTVNQMNVPPQSQMTEKTSENAIIVVTPEDLAAGKKAYKGKNPILGKLFNVTFKVPEDCIAAKIDMDKIAEINPNRLGSFAERLQGWNIERRQRLMTTKSAPRIDWSFKHSSSKREFRSVVEVVNYILYETYPRNPNKDNMMIPNEDMTEEVSSVNPKRESTSICYETEKAKRNKEFVEEFLKDSWLNLMNSINSEGDNMQEENQEFSYVDVDDESVESETAEKMIEAVYNEKQERDEEFSYVDTDDESVENETAEEMMEEVYNDMIDNANKTNVVMNDNDGKETASEADPEQVQGTLIEAQASNKNMSPHSED